MPPRAFWSALGVAAIVGACASVTPVISPEGAVAAGSLHDAPATIDGTDSSAHWYLPDGNASALLVLEPGFTRRCSHLRETARQLMAGGLMVVCVDASMAGGNPALADAFARWLVDEATAPRGRALPQRIIVGGHSAGAAFAVRLGAQLTLLVPQRLAGALLFDPVAAAGFEPELRALSADGLRPVLALLALPGPCNANSNALPALRALGPGAFFGVQLTQGATHVDVEGEDSDWLGRAVCGEPQPDNVARLRMLAVQGAAQIARGQAPSFAPAPGWRWIDASD